MSPDSPRRILHVPEDAADGCVLYIPGPDEDHADAYDLEDRPDTLQERRYADMHPWRCADCNQPAEPEWHRCPMCGKLREECEA
ncbi:MAG: hypothetical protein AMXMBFR53_36470 [Gemmatimonadota bacterium]